MTLHDEGSGVLTEDEAYRADYARHAALGEVVEALEAAVPHCEGLRVAGAMRELATECREMQARIVAVWD